MIKLENTEVYGWEAAIRGMYNGKGVRKISDTSFESYISSHGKFLSCGTYQTKTEAQEAVIVKKIKLFGANVIANGDEPDKVVETVERGYFASPQGNIYNRHGILMLGVIDRCGYRQVILNRKNYRVHRVIAQALLPNPENLPCVNHKDGDKLNNSVSNLEWCTHSENTKHAYEVGLERRRCGEEHHNHKLTEDDVKHIREVYIKRHSLFGAVALSERYGVDRTTIHDIVNGKTWRGIL